MYYRNRMALPSKRGLELEQAARVAGGNYFGVEWGNELGFAVSEGIGGVRLHQVVDAGGAAADGGFWDFG